MHSQLAHNEIHRKPSAMLYSNPRARGNGKRIQEEMLCDEEKRVVETEFCISCKNGSNYNSSDNFLCFLL